MAEAAAGVRSGVSPPAGDPAAETSLLRQENFRLGEQLRGVREKLERHQQELVRVRRQLARAEEQGRRMGERCASLEQQKSEMAKLYVAASFLHQSLEREVVLGAMGELVINLLGSEEFGIFEWDEATARLSLAHSVGIDPALHARLPVGVGPVGRVVRTGEPYVRGRGDDDGDAEAAVVACIPLKLGGRVTGVVAVFGLLPQKTTWDEFDDELFSLLSTHGGSALHAAALHASAAAGAP